MRRVESGRSMAKKYLKGDLYNQHLPISAYEPLSELQRRADIFAYTELLDQVPYLLPDLFRPHLPGGHRMGSCKCADSSKNE